MGLGTFLAGYAIGRHRRSQHRESSSDRAWREYQERQAIFDEQVREIDRFAERRRRRYDDESYL